MLSHLVLTQVVAADHVEAAGFILKGIKGVFLLIGGVIAAVICALVAKAKSYSAVLFAVLGLFFSIITLIVVLVIPAAAAAPDQPPPGRSITDRVLTRACRSWVLRRRRPMSANLDAGCRLLEERRFAAWRDGRRAGLPAGVRPAYPEPGPPHR